MGFAGIHFYEGVGREEIRRMEITLKTTLLLLVCLINAFSTERSLIPLRLSYDSVNVWVHSLSRVTYGRC